MRTRAAAGCLAALLAVLLVATGCTSARGTWTDRDGTVAWPDDTSSLPSPASRLPPRQHSAEPQDGPVTRLAVRHHRRSPGVIAAGGADAPYNYGPTVMREGAHTRMWWCSQYGAAKPAGDDVLHGSARRMRGRFTSARGGKPRAVLSGSRRGFDGMHTCDPSVVRVGGVYYLYYTGARGDHDFGNAIGLATSKDGLRWRRVNGGKPIVRPAHEKRRANAYGAGQPAVVHLDGWFYLMFTDTTAGAAGWNGAGQFLLRSPDPAFRDRVQALGEDGFEPVGGTGAARTSSLADAFSADLMWVDVLDAFAVAHQTKRGTTLTFWRRDFTARPYRRVTVPGPWREGPGLVRTPAGHAPIAERDPCGTVPIDLARATRDAAGPTGLRHFGMDLVGATGCDTRAEALRLLDGYAFPSPERTMDLMTPRGLVRVERRSVAAALARHGLLARRPSELPGLPVTARLNSGAEVLRSRDGTTGIVLDDERLWPLRKPSVARRVARRNDAAVRTVGDITWVAYPLGSVLG